jgi:hypothetical protein
MLIRQGHSNDPQPAKAFSGDYSRANRRQQELIPFGVNSMTVSQVVIRPWYQHQKRVACNRRLDFFLDQIRQNS